MDACKIVLPLKSFATSQGPSGCTGVTETLSSSIYQQDLLWQAQHAEEKVLPDTCPGSFACAWGGGVQIQRVQ